MSPVKIPIYRILMTASIIGHGDYIFYFAETSFYIINLFTLQKYEYGEIQTEHLKVQCPLKFSVY